MSQVKAEFNHKSCAERYDVIETLDTPVWMYAILRIWFFTDDKMGWSGHQKHRVICVWA